MIRIENTWDRDIHLSNGVTVPKGRAVAIEKRAWEGMRQNSTVSFLIKHNHLVASDMETALAVPVVAEADQDRFEAATKDQLKAELDAAGIDYESRATAAELRDLAREKIIG